MLLPYSHFTRIPFSSSSTKIIFFPSSSYSSYLSANAFLSYQIEEEMGEVEFGLKQSVQEELFCKETYWAGNGQNGVVFTGDDSFVDQFLNLQNGDDPQEVDFPGNLQINTKASAFLPPPLLQPIAAAEEDLCSVLTLRPEEEPELEWLSHFMDDSFSPSYPAGARIPPPPENPSLENETPSCFSPAPALPRSQRRKRHRSARGPVWAISSSSVTESTTSSSSSSSTTSPSTPLEIQTPALNPNKKLKNQAGPGLKHGSGPAVLARECSHCGSQKTPQWRAGPMGAKTLCNACGVRFKSGRLFPEYRPASSPTFSSEAHSNSHRKVLEMRKKKANMDQPEPGFESALSSFG